MRFFVIIFLCIFPFHAHACSCGSSNDTAALFKRASAVILAEITSTKAVKSEYNDHDVEYIIADINILDTFKQPKHPITQVLDLVPDGGNCSIGLVAGMEYLFFIDNNDEEDPELETNNYVGACTGSHHVNIYHKDFQTESDKLRALGQ